MRIVLVGPAHERARLRAQMNGTALDIVGEFPTLAAARSADVDADAVMMADQHTVRLKPDPTYLKPDPTYLESDAAYEESLTPREVQVLELLAEGLANKAIAERLHISDQTVKFHVASIAGKLGAANRTDVVRRAVRRGLIAL